MSDYDLGNLTDFEHVALIALHRLVIRADNQLSVHETRAFKALAHEMGEARFRAIILAARERYPTEEDARGLIDALGRPSARRQIYRRLRALADTNQIAGPEADMLRWIASSWQLEIDPTTLALVDAG